MNASFRPSGARSGLRGFSTVSAMFWVMVVVGTLYVFFKVLPAMNEHFAIRKTVRGIVASGPATPLEVQNSFDRQKGIDGIESIPLFGGVSLLIRYDGSTRKGGN